LRIRFRHKDITVALYAGARSVRSVDSVLAELRRRCDENADVLTSTHAFLADSARSSTIPMLALMHRGCEPFGAVLLHGSTRFGIPTGVVSAGHLCGHGGAIAPVSERMTIAEVAARVLVRNCLAHTVVIRLLQGDPDYRPGETIPAHETEGSWTFRDARSRFSLDGGMEGLLSRLTSKFRRNLGYYRRQADKELALKFLPNLSPAQSRDAVEALIGRSAYSIAKRAAFRDRSALCAQPNSFAMGLQDGDGNWLCVMVGRRSAKALYVEWQLNSPDHPAASLSTVMRAHCIEHEVANKTQDIIFVGETNPIWKRACAPEVCGDLLVVGGGVIGLLARKMALRLSPSGQITQMYIADSKQTSLDPV
jgi:hypothetical protein